VPHFALSARLFTTTLDIAFVAARGFEHVRLLRPLRPHVDVYLEIQVLQFEARALPDGEQADFRLKLVDVPGQVILSGTAETLVLRNAGYEFMPSPNRLKA
jgi:acyl dehydratase